MPSITVKVPIVLEVEIEWGTQSSDLPFVERIYGIGAEVSGPAILTRSTNFRPVPDPHLASSILQSAEVLDAIASYRQPEPSHD